MKCFARPRLDLRQCGPARPPSLRFTQVSYLRGHHHQNHQPRSATPIDTPSHDPLQARIEELRAAGALEYPRIDRDGRALTYKDFNARYSGLRPGESREDDEVTIRGRVQSSRIAGSKLAFLDLLQDGQRLQMLYNVGRVGGGDVDVAKFRRFCQLVRRGDIISATGTPYRTPRGELSVNATRLPRLLSPSLRQLPTTLSDPETRIRHRHVDMLVNPRGAEILRLRSHIIHYLRNFLVDAGFLDVATPIIAGRVGGATARPFITSASEFPNKELKLRIAPELWLKRLVLAGFDRVFEIGPSFRNEGIDATHNPEFTTCEFYQSFADIEELIELTQNLLRGLDRRVMELKDGHCRSLPQLHIDFSQPFKRLEFVPAIEAAIGRALPNLSAPDATFSLQSLFGDMGLPLPASPTLPRLLDKLSATYIEPQCNTPTFVTHHPECLAPLAKSYLHNGVGQRVSARIELFVQHHELANAYEEENSPLDQRRKFVEQLNYREEDDPSSTVDETYLDALEWALPPTGGWGCGVDRLVMLFSGATRIADVLSFGTMRNVVALGSQAPSRADM